MMIMAQISAAFAAETKYWPVNGPVTLLDERLAALKLAADQVPARLSAAAVGNALSSSEFESTSMVVGWEGLRHAFRPRTALDHLCRRIQSGGRLIYGQHLTGQYQGLTAKWLLDYFVAAQYADCRIYLLWPPDNNPAVATFDYKWIIEQARPTYNPMWDNVLGATAVLVVAEKPPGYGYSVVPDDERPRMPIQDNYRSAEQWDEYAAVLRRMLVSPRPWHLAGPPPAIMPPGCRALDNNSATSNKDGTSVEAVQKHASAADRQASGSTPIPETPLAQAPKVTTPGYSLQAAPGVNIQATGEMPVIEGQQVERITAASSSKDSENRHYLALQIIGLESGRTYRITGWVRADSRTNLALQARDHPDDDHPPNNGIGLFAPADNQVLGTEMRVNGAGVMIDGFTDWKRIWIDSPTSDGNFAVMLFLLDGTNYSFAGGSQHQIIFGGIDAVPQP